jgi:hypothetical protein
MKLCIKLRVLTLGTIQQKPSRPVRAQGNVDKGCRYQMFNNGNQLTLALTLPTESRKLRRLFCYLSIVVFSLGSPLVAPCFSAEDSNATKGQLQNVPAPPDDNPSQPTTLSQIEAAVRANRRKAAAIVIRALNAEQPATITFAGQAVAASIRGLGKKITRIGIGRIVLAAVEARPAAVLEIIRVAISQTRKDLHPEIVAAAESGVAAVGDPYMPISVTLVESGALGYEAYQPGSGQGFLQVVAGYKFDQGATLAEVIVQVAYQSGSNESLAFLSNAANAVLQRGTSPDSFASLGQLPQNRPGITATPRPRTPITRRNPSTPTSTPPPIIEPLPTPPSVSP